MCETRRSDEELVAELDRYLAELESELGPIPESEAAAARAWVDSLERAAKASLEDRHAQKG